MGILEWLRPDGDPAGMRAYAARLHAAAGDLDSAGDGAARSVEAATFVGPAGDRARVRAGRLRVRSDAAAGALRTLADEIARRATEVETAQRDYDRVLERIGLDRPGG